MSYEYWESRFRAAPDLLEETHRLHDQSFRIVGVLEPGFSELDVGTSPDIWFAIPAGEGGRLLVALDAGIQPPQLEAALAPTFAQFLKQQPSGSTQGNERYLAKRLAVVDASTGLSATGTRERFADPLETLAIAAGVLLVIGCANVGLLLFALHASRRAEMAVRASLGASAGRLIRQTFAETSILGTAGCLLGCGLAPWLAATLVRLVSDPEVPTRIGWHWDWRVAAVAGVFWVAVTALCAAAPAVGVARELPLRPIRGGLNLGRARSQPRLESILIAGQTCLALVLLVGAGLLQTTWRNLERLDPGFDKERLLIADLTWEHEGPRAYTNSVYLRLLDRVAALPGVSRVSISGWSYFGNNSRAASIRPEGRDNAAETDQPLCEFLSVGPGFFRTMGAELLRGRDFTPRDTERSPLVAILSASAMRLYFGSVDAVGSRFSIFAPDQPIEIVGVVADAKLNSLRDDAPPMVYLPFFQSEFRGTASMPASVEIRLLPGSTIGARDLQRMIGGAAPGLATRQVLSQNALVERSLSREKLLSVVSVSLGLLATLLAGLGLAGVVAYSITSRMREFGVRLALGARHAGLLAASVWRALLPVAAEIAIGVPLSLGVSRLLRNALFGVAPFDPPVMAGSIALLLAITIGSACAPAMRLTRIEASEAIREE